MADSSDVDAALVAKLAADTGAGGLMTLMTDGVFIDVAPANKSRFVIISLAAHEDEYVFGGCAYEKSTYLVKAVAKDAVGIGAVIKAAAARIQTLIQDAPMPVVGYQHMLTRREERIRYTEVDDVNPDTRWHHRGGRYAVFVSPTDVP